MRTVAVASGKGGTGKTTMSAVFAHLASRHLRVAVADADVEASNLPMALRVRVASRTLFFGGAKGVIRADDCTGCARCVDVCRFGAISKDDLGSYKIDAFACEGCGRCSMVCPSGAISITPSTAGEACCGDGIFGSAAFGQLEPGQDLSGKLVTEVRRLAAEAACRQVADVLLIDGPPGIGCPLIAAVASVDMLVAVAEPTVSGAHDLERLVDLAARFRMPVRVLLNKSDLSEEGAAQIRGLCASKKLPLLAEIPFEPGLAARLERFAEGDGDISGGETTGEREVAKAWQAIELELGLSSVM